MLREVRRRRLVSERGWRASSPGRLLGGLLGAGKMECSCRGWGFTGAPVMLSPRGLILMERTEEMRTRMSNGKSVS
jgi:hypothetical protein